MIYGFYLYFCKMNLTEINKTLFSQAKALKMCDAVHREWYGKSLDASALADLYFQNTDFCIDYHWPSPSVLKDLFDIDTLRSNGFVVDDKWSLLNPSRATIVGVSYSKIRFNGFGAGTIYVCDESAVEVTAKGRSFVVVHVYDDAIATVICDTTARAVVINHSKFSKITTKGQTTIKECNG